MARITDKKEKNIAGPKIREYRKIKKLSQQQLSARLETLAIYVCRGSISRIEDQSRIVSDLELYGFSQILGVPIQDFFK